MIITIIIIIILIIIIIIIIIIIQDYLQNIMYNTKAFSLKISLKKKETLDARGGDVYFAV